MRAAILSLFIFSGFFVSAQNFETDIETAVRDYNALRNYQRKLQAGKVTLNDIDTLNRGEGGKKIPETPGQKSI